MNYLHFDVGNQQAGTVVQASLRGSESDVFLVDRTNFSKFKRGQSFKYTGGHYNRSPITLQVPQTGHWTAIVIPSGRVEASVDVLG
ncbi:DUF1883 domain-containing protein [Nocardioides sp. 1609]|uniref:DUF1883 domain-containing protein n=1 Tax=Nocardioides sp. 1609 TaxID=2508327 RepID=UPI00142F7461|nr:DUF1883 domain-containing protein [Nocardioides sp. 1609]